MPDRAEIVVIGAGLTGLSLAHRLMRMGRDVRVLESGQHPGGNLRTKTVETEDGTFLLELGPNSFGDASTELIGLASEVGLAERLIRAPASANRRWLFRAGRLREVTPPGLALSPLLPLRGRLRMLREPFVRPRPEGAREESLAEFCDRRLGRAAREKLLTAVVGGIYAGDPERLGAESAFPRMVALEREHGSLIRAALKGSGPPKRGTLSSFQDGLRELPRALARELGPRLTLSAAVRALEPNGSGWCLQAEPDRTLSAARVVVATPAGTTADLLEPLAPAAAAELRAIDHPPMAVVHVGVRGEHAGGIPPGFGFLVPRGEGLRILGCIFSSRLFPNRAPEGLELLTIFSGGALDRGAPELSDSELRELVLHDLERACGPLGLPALFHTYRWPRSIPQYEVGHRDRLARVRAALAGLDGLHLAGNWSGGIAMPDCVRNAEALARELCA